MPLRISCRHCGKAFSAWEDLVGQSVRCPKCGKDMVVPPSGLDRPTPAAPPATAAPASPAARARPAAPRPELASPPRVQPPRTVKVTPGPRPFPSAPPASCSDTAAPPAVPKPAEAPPQAVDTVPCPNCGSPMPLNDDLCDQCGYHLILRKVLDTWGVQRHDDSSGFDRFLKRQLAEDETAESVVFWAQIVAGFFLVFFSTFCLGLLGFVLSVLVVGGYAAYRIANQQRHGSEQAEQQWDHVSRALWSAILLVQRAAGWRHTRWPFTKTRTLVMNAPDFDDDELQELEGLGQFETLDLEGTRISDAGLEHLATLQRLRFLVVRGTQVTPTGVRQLQRQRRETWIWS